MAIPTSFPAVLALSGQPEVIVYNQTGYNAALKLGAVYPIVTPSTRISATTTIVSTSFNGEQDDGRATHTSKGSAL